MSKPRNWQAAFDALGGSCEFGPGGREAMTDHDYKAVVMAHERANRRAEAGIPEPKSHKRALDVVIEPGVELTEAGMRKIQKLADDIMSRKIGT